MGCVLSSMDGSRNSLVFKVFNVDENGDEHNPGKIEITDSEFILRQKGRDEITWPLRCLRRYGWEEELFSFESGRRCYTGPGIYTFKCKRAELLFRAVQESIMRVGQGNVSSSQAFDHHRHSNSRPPSTIEMSDLMALTVPNGNTGLASMREMNYIKQAIVNEHEQHSYQNTAPLRANGSASFAVDTASALINILHNPLQTDPTLNPPLLNYIQVGPSNFTSNSKTPTVVSPSVPTVSPATVGCYAEIDFHRTKALSNRQVLEQDEGSRMTRHNSSITNAF